MYVALVCILICGYDHEDILWSLQPVVAPYDTGVLYQCMMRDRISQVSQITGIDFVPSGPELETLGESFDSLFARGYERVLLVNSNSPTLPGCCLEDAVQQVKWHPEKIVVGPTVGGSMYLIGMTSRSRHMVSSIPEKMHDVMGTLRLTHTRRSDMILLPEWYSLRSVHDFERLMVEMWNPEAEKLAPRTADWLARWRKPSLKSL